MTDNNHDNGTDIIGRGSVATINGDHPQPSISGSAATTKTKATQPSISGSVAMLEAERSEAEDAVTAAKARFDQRHAAWKANVAAITGKESQIENAKKALEDLRAENKTLSSLLGAAKARLDGATDELAKLHSDTVRIRPAGAKKAATKS